MSTFRRRPRAATINPASEWLLRRFSPKHRECARIEELISLAAVGMASDSERHEIDTHLASCGACRAMQGIASAARIELRERPVVMMPAGLSARLLAAVAEEQERERLLALGKERSTGRRTVRTGYAWGGGLAFAACFAWILYFAAPHHSGTMVTPIGRPNTMIAGLPPTHLPAPIKTAPTIHTGAIHVAALPRTLGHTTTLFASEPKRHSASSAQSIQLARLPVATHAHAGSDLSRHTVIVNPDKQNIAKLPPIELPLPHETPTAPETVPTPMPDEHPTQIASVPPADVRASDSPVVSSASYGSSPSHTIIPGLLRRIAQNSRRTEESATAATVTLASMTARPNYPDGVSMVSGVLH